MTVGENIKRWRTNRNLSQKELGAQIGMSQQQIGQYELGTRVPKQETLLKIAKALGVHLRDLSDDSWLEEFDQKHPTAGDAYARYKAINKYLEEMGFTISERVTKWHDEEVDDLGHTVKISDELEIILSKDGHAATFTDAEFEELQVGAKEAIEGRFYKKVLEQQKK